MAADHAEMARLTAGFSSKSEKMRALAKAGYQRGEIARFLGTSYQFVRNVLVQEEAREAREAAAGPGMREEAAKFDAAPQSTKARESTKARVGSRGELILPSQIREAMNLKEGDVLVASFEDDELRLLTMPAAVRKAQAIVRKYVPEGVSLVDELLEDRRREVERES